MEGVSNWYCLDTAFFSVLFEQMTIRFKKKKSSSEFSENTRDSLLVNHEGLLCFFFVKISQVYIKGVYFQYLRRCYKDFNSYIST